MIRVAVVCFVATLSFVPLDGAGAATLSGVFVEPNSFANGIGTNRIETGEPLPGSGPTVLTYDAPGEVAETTGTEFTGGVLSFYNGTVYLDTLFPPFSEVKLRVTSASSNPAFVQILNEPIELLNTENVGTIWQNADTLYWKNRPELGGLRALEGETVSVEVKLAFNSLDLIGFGDVLTPTTGFLTASPFTPVDPDFSPAPVPLPAALPLMAGAFGLLGLVRSRRRRP